MSRNLGALKITFVKRNKKWWREGNPAGAHLSFAKWGWGTQEKCCFWPKTKIQSHQQDIQPTTMNPNQSDKENNPSNKPHRVLHDPHAPRAKKPGQASAAPNPCNRAPTMRELQEDNGEQFLSKHFHDNKARTKETPEHPLNDRCKCEMCSRNPQDNQVQVTNRKTIAEDPQVSI